MRRHSVTHHRATRYAAVLLWLAGASLVYADSRPLPYEAIVAAPGAPVLSGPGDTFYAVDTLAQGEQVEVHRERADGWLGIRPPADSFSWVFGRHVKLLDNGLAEVETDDAASRIGSRLGDQHNAVQVRLNKGELVEVIGEQSISGQSWYKIAPPAGEFRWIHRRYISDSNESPVEPQLQSPIVTVPVANESADIDAAAITLAADAQPASGDEWRAAANETAAAVASDEATDVTAPPLTVVPGAADPPQSASPATSALPGSPDPALAASAAPLAAQAAAQPGSATNAPVPAVSPVTSPAVGPVSDGLSRQLTELEMQLSRVVAEPPANWQIEPLANEAERLLAQSQTIPERAAVQTTLAKIDRFAAIGRRYRFVGAGSGDPRTALGSGDPRIALGPGDPRTATVGAARIIGNNAPTTGQLNPPAAAPGQPPITPIAGAATGIAGPDGQRYDAVGILRPVVSKRPGAPQFALLNDRGQVVSFVTPAPDVNLQPYIGHRVGVTGSRGFIPEFQRAHVTAGRVAPFAGQMLR